MRIRAIKPEFWRSEDITALSIEARLLFIGLWSYVDDNGVGIDNERVITADLFANEDDMKAWRARVSRGIRELASRGLVTRYTVSGRSYLHITKWDLHQKIDRPSKPRYPGPENAETPENTVAQQSLDEASRQSRDSLDAGTGEQGNRGTEDQGTDSRARDAKNPDRFAEFWDAYPSKRAKPDAQRAFTKALTKATADAVIAGARRYRDDPNREDAYTAHAATWLNREGWDEPPLPARLRPAAGQSRPVYDPAWEAGM